MDKMRLQQVLSNLIQNSIKYSYTGVITISARVFEEGDELPVNNYTINEDHKSSLLQKKEGNTKNRVLEIKVRDQGIGMKDLKIIGKMFN